MTTIDRTSIPHEWSDSGWLHTGVKTTKATTEAGSVVEQYQVREDKNWILPSVYNDKSNKYPLLNHRLESISCARVVTITY